MKLLINLNLLFVYVIADGKATKRAIAGLARGLKLKIHTSPFDHYY